MCICLHACIELISPQGCALGAAVWAFMAFIAAPFTGAAALAQPSPPPFDKLERVGWRNHYIYTYPILVHIYTCMHIYI